MSLSSTSHYNSELSPRLSSSAGPGDTTTLDAKVGAPEWLISNISDTSKSASQIYVLYMSFLAYSLLTIFTTSDEQLFLNQSTLLPLVNLNVPSNLFFIFAPLIAIGLFVQLQFYLVRLRTMLSGISETYAPLERERLYPWLVTFADESDQGFVSVLQRRVVEFSLWWLLPIVLLLFAFLTLKRHIVGLSVILAILHLAGTSFVVYFWGLQNPTQPFGRRLLLILMLFLESLLLVILIFVVRPGYLRTRQTVQQSLTKILTSVRNLTAVNLSYHDFSTKVERTFLMHDLQGVHLEGAELRECVFAKANLSEAYLQSADLNLADIRGADLHSAHLEEADLSSVNGSEVALNAADLTDAFLPGAELSKAELVWAVLKGAQLPGANLKKANLSAANLNGANINGTDFEGADLRNAVGLTVPQLSTACTLYKAQLDEPLMSQMKLKYPKLFQEPTRDENGDCVPPKVD